MAKAKQKRIDETDVEEVKLQPRTRADRNRVTKRLYSEFEECLAQEYKTASALQYDAYDHIIKIDDSYLNSKLNANNGLKRVKPDMSEKSTTSRLRMKPLNSA